MSPPSSGISSTWALGNTSKPRFPQQGEQPQPHVLVHQAVAQPVCTSRNWGKYAHAERSAFRVSASRA
eukprot:10629577-Heterocapsa_arctica.AAC.1